MRDFLSSGNNANLVERANFRTETAVDTQNLAVDDGCQGEEIEDLTARLPHGSVAVLLLTLLVEAVDLGDLSRFVVTTDERDLVGVS